MIFLKSIRNLCLVLLYLKKHKRAGEILDESEKALVIYKKNTNIDVRTELFTLFVLIRTNILIYHDLVKDNISKQIDISVSCSYTQKM